MKYRAISSRRHILEVGIDRLSRLLEAERASAHARKPIPPIEQVGTGIHALLESDKAIAPKKVSPYEEFSPGLKVGYEDCGGKVWTVVDFEPSKLEERQNGDPSIRAPRLGVHPVFSGSKNCGWMTLESRVDKGQIKNTTKLGLRLVAEFSFGTPGQELHTNSVKASLRCDKPDRSYEDIDLGFFPITTVPTCHTFVCQSNSLNEAWLASFSSLRLILWLPNYGSYRFNLYGLSLEAE